MTREVLERLRRRHTEANDGSGHSGVCDACAHDPKWPCDANRLIADLEQARDLLTRIYDDGTEIDPETDEQLLAYLKDAGIE